MNVEIELIKAGGVAAPQLGLQSGDEWNCSARQVKLS